MTIQEKIAAIDHYIVSMSVALARRFPYTCAEVPLRDEDGEDVPMALVFRPKDNLYGGGCYLLQRNAQDEAVPPAISIKGADITLKLACLEALPRLVTELESRWRRDEAALAAIDIDALVRELAGSEGEGGEAKGTGEGERP